MIKKVVNLKKNRKETLLGILVVALLITILQTSIMVVYNANENNMPMTGESEFDAMYQYYMDKDMPMLQDIMEPANYAGFFIIKLATNIVGLIILVVTVVTFASALAYGAKPDIADEVHEVKMEVASGQKIPIDEPIRWIMRFMPDIKSASGIADDYEYERPTIGLVFRDNIWKFLVIFTLSILLSTHTIATFLVKTGGATAYGVRHYVDNTDMRGIVNTFTTSGKDYNPRFDTLTVEGRNKKKVFNAIYNATKSEKPRDRTDDFLSKIGTAIHSYVSSLEGSGERQLNYAFKNFSATADVHSYALDPDISPVKVVIPEPLSTFMPGEMEAEGKFVYITVIQYNDEDVESSGRPGASSSSNAFVLDNSGKPTSLNLANLYTSKLTNHKFVKNGDGKVNVKVEFSSGNPEIIPITLSYASNGKNVTANLSSVGTKINQRTSGGDVRWTRVTVTGLSRVVGFQNEEGKSAGSVSDNPSVANNN